MTEDYVRISDLPSSDAVTGLCSIGTDSHGESVKIPIGDLIVGLRTMLDTKFDKSKVDRTAITDDCFAVPSSQAVLGTFRAFSEVLSQKADASDVTAALDEKAEKSDLISLAGTVQMLSATKADKAALSQKVDISEMQNSLSTKADKSEVETALAEKADKIVCVESESELMALEQQGLLKEGQLYGILEEE